MRLKMGAVVALNSEDLTTPDFSSEAWGQFREAMLPEGVDMLWLNKLSWMDHEIDGEQSLFSVILDARALRNMWLRAVENWNIHARYTGDWLSDTCIPPHEWQCPSRGESAYWWWGVDCKYTIGITAVDLETAEAVS